MTLTGSHRPLWSGFHHAASEYSTREALRVGDETLTYEALHEASLRVAATLQAYPEYHGPGLTAIFAQRTRTAFVGVLGTLLSGRGYTPLSRIFPVALTKLMLELSDCRSIIVDLESLSQLGDVLDGRDSAMLILIPDAENVSDLRTRFRPHTVLGARDLRNGADWRQPVTDRDAVAYLLFTSGSTGIPKGVMVSHRNVTAFLDHAVERYDITENDRLSQLFDMTFDLSVFDMFVAWERGACVCCPAQKALLNPARFVRENSLTVWFSVPSTAIFMKRLGALKPNAFPSLRWSLFCGEPLTTAIAELWARVAPNAPLENLYGPTELTIACTQYRWAGGRSVEESEIGIVPIGDPLPGMEALVLDDHLQEVQPGEAGELVMSGPQMSLGYLDMEKTREAFVALPGRDGVFYRTGDRVRRPVGGAPMTHLGRLDSQIKIRGHRVELGEVEAAVRWALGRDGIAAVPWPYGEGGCEGIEVFIEGEPDDLVALRAAVASRVPDYMVPSRFHFVEQLPLSARGKLDRRAIQAMLSGQR